MKVEWRQEESTGPRFGCLNKYLSTHAWEETKKATHRSMGRRFTACVTADMADRSKSCAAQMEEIDSSKEFGLSRSAGTKVFKSSTVGVGSEFKVGRTDVDSGSGGRDAPLREGESNLTVDFVYGRGRTLGGTLRTRNHIEKETHSSRFACLLLTTRLPSS